MPAKFYYLYTTEYLWYTKSNAVLTKT